MPKALDALVKASSISVRHSLDGINGVAHLLQSRIWGTYGTRLIVDVDKYEYPSLGVLILNPSPIIVQVVLLYRRYILSFSYSTIQLRLT